MKRSLLYAVVLLATVLSSKAQSIYWGYAVPQDEIDYNGVLISAVIPPPVGNQGIWIMDKTLMSMTPGNGTRFWAEFGAGLLYDSGTESIKVDASLFATAAQGTKADNAVQPASLSSTLSGYVTNSSMTTAMGTKMDANPGGSTAQYMRGNGTLATFPTAVSSFTNDANYVTSSSLTTTLGSYATTSSVTSALSGKMNADPGGTTSQYVRGNGTLATLATVGTTGSYNDLSDKPTIPGSTTATAVYGAGTAYTVTTTSAAVTMGTTNPVWTVPATGTYLLMPTVQARYAGVTTLSTQTLNIKLRRTNNTATDLTNATTTAQIPVLGTALTGTVPSAPVPNVIYSATAGDTVTFFTSINGSLNLGSIQITEASIVGVKLD